MKKGKTIFGYKLALAFLKQISSEVLIEKQALGLNVPKEMQSPRLAIILVGDHPASLSYIRKKRQYANKAHVKTRLFHITNVDDLSPDLIQSKIGKIMKDLNSDPKYNGILLQLPLHQKVSSLESKFLDLIDPSKDVDCLGMVNRLKFQKEGELALTKPCVVEAVLRILKSKDIELKDKSILIIGKGKLTGQPLNIHFSKLSPNVKIVDNTNSLEEIKQYSRKSDIVITATGTQDLLSPDDLKKDCVIIDIGCSPDPNKPGKVRGDFSEELKQKVCSYYTPVPRGVGPMVVASLIHNVHKAWLSQIKKSQK